MRRRPRRCSCSTRQVWISSSSSVMSSARSASEIWIGSIVLPPNRGLLAGGTIAAMSLFGIEASRDLRAPLAEPSGFRLPAIAAGFRGFLARVEVGDHVERGAVVVFGLGQTQFREDAVNVLLDRPLGDPRSTR